MTREEAIHIIEKDIQIDVRSCTNEEVHAFITALNMAIAALREQEEGRKGCMYCDIAKANEGVINHALWVKESETHKWTLAGKRLTFCPMCGRRLEEA